MQDANNQMAVITSVLKMQFISNEEAYGVALKDFRKTMLSDGIEENIVEKLTFSLDTLRMRLSAAIDEKLEECVKFMFLAIEASTKGMTVGTTEYNNALAESALTSRSSKEVVAIMDALKFEIAKCHATCDFFEIFLSEENLFRLNEYVETLSEANAPNLKALFGVQSNEEQARLLAPFKKIAIEKGLHLEIH